jgi:hypothetical protein
MSVWFLPYLPMSVTNVKDQVLDMSPALSRDPFNVSASISLVIFRINVVEARG